MACGDYLSSYLRSNRCYRDSITILAGFPSSRPSRVVDSCFGASLVLAIMILPTIIAISRDTLTSLPPKLRQGAYGLGATRWETIMRVLLPAALSGIIGSIMLATGSSIGRNDGTDDARRQCQSGECVLAGSSFDAFVADCQPVLVKLAVLQKSSLFL